MGPSKFLAVAAGIAFAALPAAARGQQSTGAGPAAASSESLGQRVEAGLGAAKTATGGAAGAAIAQKALGWLHQTNTTAIQGGRLAEQKGSSSTVKQLGSKLVADHSALEQEVATLAKARGIHLPGTRGGTQAGASTGLGALTSLKRAAFDSAFLKWVAGRQQQDATQARSAQASAQQAGEPALAGLLGKVAPQLEAHAQSAHFAQQSAPARQARSGSGQ